MKNIEWARLPAYETGLVNQQLLLQNEYLAAENRILRAKLPKRLRLTHPQKCLDPSNFCAISRRYHPRIVSGFTTHATCFSALRPSRFPISASVGERESGLRL
jgi:hypothetical protein